MLARTVVDRRWLLHACVLMSNHYHLLIETPEVGLSREMKSLNQAYAENFNDVGSVAEVCSKRRR